jgi:4-aminobutyrate aminotransferase/(S)-3-amino-2-methylpropionate transaminase
LRVSEVEAIFTPIPGPRSRELSALVSRYEARGVTYVGDDYPVAWAEAHGALVTDVDGNRYLDLTAAFGVAAVGHTNPRVRDAIVGQAQRLIHGMGDVHPPAVKARLLERLAAIAPGDCSKTYFGSNGGDAIEFALKTAYLATGRPRALAFLGAYHGLSLGALPVAGIARFREPFAPLIEAHTSWLPFPGAGDSLDATLTDIERAFEEDPEIGAVVLEPIQGRGGVIVPPDGFLRGVRELCDRFAAVMILDEIYTGFGRTGPMFACEREHVIPDMLCIGKALAGGVPLSAAIGRPAVVDAWPASDGEALHTSTFLGNPLACAAALAVLDEFEETPLLASVARRAPWMRETLGALQRHPIVIEVRGLGMLWAIEFPDAATANRVVRAGLQRGVILLQSGVEGTSITLAPPLTIEDDQLARAIALFDASIKENA